MTYGQQLQQELQKINKDSNYSILTVDQDFKNEEINLKHPRDIHEALKNNENTFQKLKFTYLEQETRDNVLRQIAEMDYKLSADEGFVTQREFELQQELTTDTKQTLKKNKVQMNDKIDNLVTIANEIDELLQENNDRTSQVKDLLAEIAKLENDIQNFS
ncbi:hypothetical protein G210_1367 [Candida maltosa Xu316]|uniref:Kinetochore protein Sos7 coiled-coil domain-containing protein n=1 Tax=Candida maltosa (strain Xu316) TaxID=1245528 RepID=M3INZ8_CANMX|nr:hypothetical protein G210_1367 [Candida maltosa Xu316]